MIKFIEKMVSLLGLNIMRIRQRMGQRNVKSGFNNKDDKMHIEKMIILLKIWYDENGSKKYEIMNGGLNCKKNDNNDTTIAVNFVTMSIK